VDHPRKAERLSYNDGVSYTALWRDSWEAGKFGRVAYPAGTKAVGGLPPPAQFPNHVSGDFQDWVTQHLAQELLPRGMIRVWDVATEGGIPHVVSSLNVEESKPRLCFDGRYINLFARAIARLLLTQLVSCQAGWSCPTRYSRATTLRGFTTWGWTQPRRRSSVSVGIRCTMCSVRCRLAISLARLCTPR
jgi:hypothetical protein